ncbi:AAA family ATPase [Methyloligella sp. 2.7D]|uniref:ATP-dependent DNA helicase n=1 Tax=unclassified Methyloligella TaxID=2625955 RepID=UPI00157CB49C|nr:PIF1 family DEAD/DEAH box helicase [Methyloligella sp. GL2]QKP77712.1 AAA family ATPase [Methyloligella sp. GL2]
MKQTDALALLKTGASIFLTGEPGSGKTHTVNRYIRTLREHGVAVAYTASTGIAATHGNGITIHAWSGIGVNQSLSRRDLDRIKANRRVAGRIEKTQVLIIDEISMLPAYALDLVDQVCRHVRENPAPFGGLQLVLVGDFFQLPPVVRRERSDQYFLGDMESDSGPIFAYGSSAWRDLSPAICYLSEQHRQSDRDFVELLAAIRANRCNGAFRERLQQRMAPREALPADCTRLFTHNASVDEINARALDRLEGKPHSFAMVSKGPEAFVRTLQRGCLSPERLVLKLGAVVMFTKNDPKGRYVNGTLGEIVDFEPEHGYPVVRARDGRQIVAEPAKWKIEENGKERASLTQLPLRLAWAMTVHKSQGMSLDAAVIDLSRAFEYGQGYVALSRLRGLSGLHLLGLNDRALQVHGAAVEKDEEFRQLSKMAAKALTAAEPEALALRQETFLGSAREAEAPAGGSFAELRETHAKAYMPWSKQEEAELVRRYQGGDTVRSIAESFGRKPGAIRSRLKKLELM